MFSLRVEPVNGGTEYAVLSWSRASRVVTGFGPYAWVIRRVWKRYR